MLTLDCSTSSRLVAQPRSAANPLHVASLHRHAASLLQLLAVVKLLPRLLAVVKLLLQLLVAARLKSLPADTKHQLLTAAVQLLLCRLVVAKHQLPTAAARLPYRLAAAKHQVAIA